MVWDAEVRQSAAHWSKVFGVAIDPALIHGVIEKESSHGRNPNYVRNGGIVPEPGGHVSYGPMQLYDTTVAGMRLGIRPEDLATHPSLGIWYGTREFARRLKALGGDPLKAIASWNPGAGRSYVDAVVGFWNKYKGAVQAGALPALALAGLVVWFLARGRRTGAAA